MYETVFDNFINENSEEFNSYSSIHVNKKLIDKCPNVTGRPTFYVSNPSIIENGVCNGNLNLDKGCILQNDLIVGGALSIEY